jgi:hypothetical protein
MQHCQILEDRALADRAQLALSLSKGPRALMLKSIAVLLAFTTTSEPQARGPEEHDT